jgi:hypothetical protein
MASLDILQHHPSSVGGQPLRFVDRRFARGATPAPTS